MEPILVFMPIKSSGRFFPGIWNSVPGDKSANSAAAMSGAAQSFILSLTKLSKTSPSNTEEEEEEEEEERRIITKA